MRSNWRWIAIGPPESADRREFAPGRSGGLPLLGPGRQDRVLVRPDRTMAVAIAELVAVAERHALWSEEAAEEGAYAEDLVADQLEQPPDLPLGHRAQAQARHVDERAQVRRHDEVRAGGVREHESRVLGRDALRDEVAIERQGAVDLRLVALPDIRVGLGDRRWQHRRRVLERHVALALLVEGDPGTMAHELVGQRP